MTLLPFPYENPHFGIPFRFLRLEGRYTAAEGSISAPYLDTKIISPLGFIGNVTFWYLISCLVLLGINKIRGKNVKASK